ncbi:unknown [Succinatimonas sp. CAG:777]|nr:unknown [Succinatimonas sp. CAG:777]
MIFATVLFIFVMLYGFGIISLMIYEFCKNNKS